MEDINRVCLNVKESCALDQSCLFGGAMPGGVAGVCTSGRCRVSYPVGKFQCSLPRWVESQQVVKEKTQSGHRWLDLTQAALIETYLLKSLKVLQS